MLNKRDNGRLRDFRPRQTKLQPGRRIGTGRTDRSTCRDGLSALLIRRSQWFDKKTQPAARTYRSTCRESPLKFVACATMVPMTTTKLGSPAQSTRLVL